MKDSTLMRTGVVGAVLAAICCATPLLAVVLGAVGLSAWVAHAGYIVMPALVLFIALVGWALIRRQKPKENL